MSETRYLPLDEDGFFIFEGQRVEDAKLGRTLTQNLQSIDGARFMTALQSPSDPNAQKAWVEVFDAPLIARQVTLSDDPKLGEIESTYGVKARFSFQSLSVDEWDRFHGLTLEQIPFVLSRSAQMQFFEMLEGFDDESITLQGVRYLVPSWLLPPSDTQDESFWSRKYQQSKNPGFDLGQEAQALPVIVPQLKLAKSRILVLGCGKGHDAAYFARLGHSVTAVDFSPEALSAARKLYGHIDGLQFESHDVFHLPESWNGRFDIVFEHTLYCAIPPERRNDLVRVWRRLLHAQGHVLGVFFANENRSGPPWGSSEWELRERLKSDFKFLFWTRWRLSIESRINSELIIYARRSES